MVKSLKERAREATRRIADAAGRASHDVAIGTRAIGRRVSSAASRRRNDYCARAARPRSNADVARLVNRALRRAMVGVDLPVQQISDVSSAIRIGQSLNRFPGRDDSARSARLAGEAALHVGYAMQSGDDKEWAEAAEYADDSLDQGPEAKENR